MTDREKLEHAREWIQNNLIPTEGAAEFLEVGIKGVYGAVYRGSLEYVVRGYFLLADLVEYKKKLQKFRKKSCMKGG